MKIKKPPGLRLIIFVFASIAVLFAVSGYIKNSNREFELSEQTALKHSQSLTVGSFSDLSGGFWSILDKLFTDKEIELATVPVAIGDKYKTYFEDRKYFKLDGTISTTQQRLSDQEKTLGLKLMNIETGETEIIAVNVEITTDGVRISSPDNYQIEIVERENGIRWNYWNTEYRVVKPENTVVIKNNFPREETVSVLKVANGRVIKESKKATTGFLYAPYSDYLHQETIIEFGRGYDEGIVSWAFSILRERGVKSKAFPDKLVADVEALSPRFFERLPLLEQMDFTEFVIDPQKSAERVLVIIGANQENAWAHTCNSSDACGWVQFTPGTYSYMRTSYPAAELIISFREGAADHVNSIMAAILLHDSNLSNLIKRYGGCVAEDPRLEELLDASYNGSPRHVFNSLDITLTDSCDIPSDWGVRLKAETLGFMDKLRYLIENDLP